MGSSENGDPYPLLRAAGRNVTTERRKRVDILYRYAQSLVVLLGVASTFLVLGVNAAAGVVALLQFPTCLALWLQLRAHDRRSWRHPVVRAVEEVGGMGVIPANYAAALMATLGQGTPTVSHLEEDVVVEGWGEAFTTAYRHWLAGHGLAPEEQAVYDALITEFEGDLQDLVRAARNL